MVAFCIQVGLKVAVSIFQIVLRYFRLNLHSPLESVKPTQHNPRLFQSLVL